LKRGTFENGDRLITQSSLKCRCNESRNTSGKESLFVEEKRIAFSADKKLRLRHMVRKQPNDLNLNILNTELNGLMIKWLNNHFRNHSGGRLLA
jgi:hypothetical protein